MIDLNTVLILAPLLLVLIGAVLAALHGLLPLSRRLSLASLSVLLSLFPLGAFVALLMLVPQLNDGQAIGWQFAWLPSAGLSLGFYVDSLAALFALIITFIGVLVVIYAGQYFKSDQSAWRFLVYLLLFMASMLGLVMAGDVVTLFIFWEGTSIVSFLLVAYKYKDEAARQGAFKALFITGGGGIALLAGLLIVAHVAGSADLPAILGRGEQLRNSALYPVMLGLVALGAFTKSAQFPAHIWLPGAMSAPTPASAYLHSATMVKAGIYLMARLNPALGNTESWFWLLTTVGLLTMLAGAYLGLKQDDLKALLAYSTISQLGLLMMLIGQDNEEAFKAFVIGVLAHALYKSALFLVVGIVDHETGTRDLRRLGGLRRVMPYTFVIGLVAALSMAGLPPLFGFLAKETLLAAAIHPTLPPAVGVTLAWAGVVAGAFLLAQAALLVRDTFLGRPKDASIRAHEAPWPMWLMPAVPAALSLVVGLLPGPREEAVLLAGAASNAYGGPVKVSLELWHGINVPLMLSAVAITLGALLFVFRQPVRDRQKALAPRLTFNALYSGVLAGIFAAGRHATRLQQGRLRLYLSVMVAAAFALVVLFSGASLLPDLSRATWPTLGLFGFRVLRLFALVVAAGASLATVLLRRDFAAILALTAAGLAMAVLFVLDPAPDVALVQIVVDILTTVILVLALTRIPRGQRAAAQRLAETELQGRHPANLLRDVLLAGAIGLVVASLTFSALTSRSSRDSVVTPYYETNAKPLAGASDIVGAIVVDFRQLDTVIEIIVFAAAGLGVYMLLRMASVHQRDRGEQFGEQRPPPVRRTQGIGGPRPSAFIRLPTLATLPIALLLAATHMMYGHQQPGDGFTAGVIIALAVALWYVVFGYDETRRRLPWLRGVYLIGLGLFLVAALAVLSWAFTGYVFGHVNFSASISGLLPKGFDISTAFLFEVAICLTVLGSVALVLNTLGHPGDEEETET